jgi:hypothetical protein
VSGHKPQFVVAARVCLAASHGGANRESDEDGSIDRFGVDGGALKVNGPS